MKIMDVISSYEESFNAIQTHIEEESLVKEPECLHLIFTIYEKYALRTIEEEGVLLERGKKLLKILKDFQDIKPSC